MAQRVEVELTDDLDGTDIAAGGGETVLFALDGKTYEIDLSTRNASALRETLAVYVEAGRHLKNSRGVRVKRANISADNRTIKEWVRANGFDRGRIQTRIREAFAADN